MKKICRVISLLLAALMLISVFACEPAKPVEGSGTETQPGTASQTTDKTAAVSETQTETEKSTEGKTTETEKATEANTAENVTEPPATEPPATETPTTEEPATEPPTTEEPATEPPTTEGPETDPPATEPPTEPPTTEKQTDPVTTEEPEPDDTPTDAKYFIFNELSDGTYEISAKDVKKMPVKVVIPTSYNGMAVTQIAINAFAYCTNMKYLVIPESVFAIRNYSFYHCTNLKKVTMADSVYSIEYGVFGGCTKLESVTVPRSVINIYPGAFADCSALKNVYFDDPIGWSVDKTSIASSLISNPANAAIMLKSTYTEKTLKRNATPAIKNFKMKTINDGINANVLVIYGETEEYATVTVTDLTNGKVILKEKALGPYFYGMVLLPAGQVKKVAVKVDGGERGMSKPMITQLKHTADVGNGAFIGKDSHVYLNYYDAFYWGGVSVPSEHMANVKGYLENRLAAVRSLTGKNTKIIMVICTNPATVYHSLQYTREEGGRGDYYTSTPSTQFAEYMKNNNDIFVIDLREILSKHTDRLLFMQADSHWTQVAAYYAYYLAMQKIKIDFPDMPVYDLDEDFDITYHGGGGDLLNFMGLSGMGAHALNAYVSPKREDMKVGANAPTAYIMGDSYYWCMSNYFNYMFSEIYLNSPETNPPLYDYHLNDLSTKKPDYLFYVWTERNVGGDLGIMLQLNDMN